MNEICSLPNQLCSNSMGSRTQSFPSNLPGKNWVSKNVNMPLRKQCWRNSNCLCPRNRSSSGLRGENIQLVLRAKQGQYTLLVPYLSR